MEIGVQEMILIGIVLVLFFGPKKLPEFGESIGKAIKEFKRTVRSTTLEETEQAAVEKPAETPEAHSEHKEAEATQNLLPVGAAQKRDEGQKMPF